jgi:predicted glycosyltransferase
MDTRRILVDIGHPGHVHFYKHAIRWLRDEGHDVLIAARDKDVAIRLLDHYGFPYRTVSAAGSGRWGMVRELVQRERALLQLIREFDPDVVTEIGGLSIALIGWLLRKPTVVFTDTEHVEINRYLTYPFASVICTPACFKRDLGKRHVRYEGFQELAYLHPDYFRPDPTVLDELGVSGGQPFIVLRFVAWKASHDLGQEGLSFSFKREVVETLSRYGRVFITSEAELPAEFKPHQIHVPPHRIHDVLAFARLYLGEGATMATEAGLLGTPSIYVSSLVGTMGNFEELMDRYGLVYSTGDPSEALRQAVQLMELKDPKAELGRRRDRLLADKIDVARFVFELLEGTAVNER